MSEEYTEPVEEVLRGLNEDTPHAGADKLRLEQTTPTPTAWILTAGITLGILLILIWTAARPGRHANRIARTAITQLDTITANTPTPTFVPTPTPTFVPMPTPTSTPTPEPPTSTPIPSSTPVTMTQLQFNAMAQVVAGEASTIWREGKVAVACNLLWDLEAGLPFDAIPDRWPGATANINPTEAEHLALRAAMEGECHGVPRCKYLIHYTDYRRMSKAGAIDALAGVYYTGAGGALLLCVPGKPHFNTPTSTPTSP